MKIVVLVKEVPDTWGDRRLSLETGLADRAAGEVVLDEIGERSIEVALSYADAHPDAEVVVLSMAPASALTTIRKGLAMGASSAIHVVDDALLGADLGLTAEVLAAAVRRAGFRPRHHGEPLHRRRRRGHGGDGRGASRRSRGVESHLGLGRRRGGVGNTGDGCRHRRGGIMAAKKKPVETLSLADLGVEAMASDAARSIMIAVAERPPRAAGVTIVDEGDAGERLADFLVQNRLA
ncbi:hypothetical protein LUZ63_023078 [Rhynchospora breviuscula]|uniref:Electron transfer flavoprotein alpha/beta-subunit N-terminal domain-containing protein n=1 Tax=Rhynchospora breviuscula TaxID=2022672 RepID=A0A9P9Z3L7_9POAL|nr:hypothetical protein LUZ63_023078 [Rhynchospora breviuscula]